MAMHQGAWRLREIIRSFEHQEEGASGFVSSRYTGKSKGEISNGTSK